MDLELQGRTAAVAAASAGLGLGTARALAAEGVRVAICGRDRARVEDAAAGIDGEVVALVADVSTPAGATAFVGEAAEALGQVDILVPNAGGPPAGDVAGTPLEAYQPALELNLLSTVAMCEAAVWPMAERGWGRIVAITSTAVREPAPTLVLSNVARAGATAYLKTLAREVAGRGVTVSSVQPGLHATDRLDALTGGDPGRRAALAASVPAGELGDADDLGRVVAFLCSGPARFVTGVGLPVDGGAGHGLL